MLILQFVLNGCLDFTKSKEAKLNAEILNDIKSGEDFSNWYIDHINDRLFSEKFSQTKGFQTLTENKNPYSFTILKTGFPDSTTQKVIVDKKSLNDAIPLFEKRNIESAIIKVSKEIELRNGFFYSYSVYDISKWNLGKKTCLILELSKMKQMPDAEIPGKFGEVVLKYNKYY